MSGELGAVAHYNLLERVGEGGLGEVYRARDTKYGRTVALKLAPPAFVEGQRHRRLADDARAASALSHPNIAALFDAGYHDGRPYFACEFVQGSTFRELMARGPINSVHVLELAAQAADALAEGHTHGVVHKDIRPDTLLETPKGRVKVLEFGLSLWTRGGQTRALAAASPQSVGPDALPILPYMSPEQVRGERLDGRSDVFSLAVVVYEMLTGCNPYAASDPRAVLEGIVHTVPPPPRARNADLPKMIDVVLSRALAPEREHRTESAAKLAAELRRTIAQLETPAAASAAPPRSAGRTSDLLPIEEEGRGGALWWIAGALLAALAAVTYVWLVP